MIFNFTFSCNDFAKTKCLIIKHIVQSLFRTKYIGSWQITEKYSFRAVNEHSYCKHNLETSIFFHILLKILFGLILFSQPFLIHGQIKYSKVYFRSPIDFKMLLAGNFAELRSNHFHTGLDILTEGVTRKKVYAIADGYISRINVSADGYGKALYLTHPNGYVSVYAHLNSFNKEISTYLDSVQHARQEFALNLYPLPEKFPVKKGQVIALSGNSGSSSGPHLHFEIRERESEQPVNPFLFGIVVKDHIPPKIFSLVTYQFSDSGDWEDFKRKTYKKVNGSTIKLYGKSGFGIVANDYTDERHNTNGLYSLQLYADNQLYFSVKFNKLSFFTNRYINDYIDYELKQQLNKKVNKCFYSANNKLENYDFSLKNGLINFDDQKEHHIKIIASDYFNNQTKLEFNVQSDSAYLYKSTKKSNHFKQKIYYRHENEFITENLKVIFHKNSLLYDLNFEYSHSKSVPSFAYSYVHHVHKPFTPLFNKITIAIKPQNLPDLLKKKAFVVRIDNKGKLNALKSIWDNEFLSAKSAYLGDFMIVVDTIPPNIKPINLKKGSIVAKFIKFKIYDDLSGISDYNAYIDGKWILMEYDKKYHQLFSNLNSEKVRYGKHHLKLVVTDEKENKAIYELEFIKK